MALLVRQDITRNGLEPAALVAAAADQTFKNDGKTWFRVKNAHAANPRTVTFTSQVQVASQGQAAADKAVVVDALEERWIGPFDPAAWNNEDGEIEVAYSDAAADLTVGVYRLA